MHPDGEITVIERSNRPDENHQASANFEKNVDAIIFMIGIIAALHQLSTLDFKYAASA